jgi:hypothetical protein
MQVKEYTSDYEKTYELLYRRIKGRNIFIKVYNFQIFFQTKKCYVRIVYCYEILSDFSVSDFLSKNILNLQSKKWKTGLSKKNIAVQLVYVMNLNKENG